MMWVNDDLLLYHGTDDESALQGLLSIALAITGLIAVIPAIVFSTLTSIITLLLFSLLPEGRSARVPNRKQAQKAQTLRERFGALW